MIEYAIFICYNTLKWENKTMSDLHRHYMSLAIKEVKIDRLKVMVANSVQLLYGTIKLLVKSIILCIKNNDSTCYGEIQALRLVCK